MLIVDGTHLGGKYKGVLLTTSGQDAKFQIFPLAYAIVDSEDEESWTWDLYSKVRAQRSECGVYVGNIGVAHWSWANFPGHRYNIMTSNIVEQLNHALVEGRTSHIMELVIFIQRTMTRWFSARR
ncbi:unnamed protein product, partial [Brassica oleracea]